MLSIEDFLVKFRVWINEELHTQKNGAGTIDMQIMAIQETKEKKKKKERKKKIAISFVINKRN